nr:RibD family protein [Burkholderiaceae bacterium]
RGRPWLRLKIAASLDGKTALDNGVSQWITSDAARADGHAWRARACAVLTGIGTVKADNPQMNVRLVPTARQPLKVLVDSKLEVDPTARLFDGEPVLVACAFADSDKRARLAAVNAQVIELPALPPAGESAGEAGRAKVDLPALLRELARRGINELHVEAGFKLNGSLVRENLVDELLVYLAPMLIGQAQGMVHLPALEDLALARRLAFREVTQVGEDVRIVARLV